MTVLRPSPRVWLRMVVWGLAVAFALIGTATWFSKGSFIAVALLILGTYREAWIAEGKFSRRLTVGFVPVKTRTWPLERFVEIQTKYQAPPSVEWSLLMGPVNWIFWHVFDWILPWLGGSLELRLLGATGWVLVWQGSSESNFQQNLEILQQTTRLPTVRK